MRSSSMSGRSLHRTHSSDRNKGGSRSNLSSTGSEARLSRAASTQADRLRNDYPAGQDPDSQGMSPSTSSAALSSAVHPSPSQQTQAAYLPHQSHLGHHSSSRGHHHHQHHHLHHGQPAAALYRHHVGISANTMYAHAIALAIANEQGSYNQRDSNTNRLKQILEEPALRTLFREFLKNNFCEENLSFWLDVQDFKRRFHTTSSVVTVRATLDRFLNHDGGGGRDERTQKRDESGPNETSGSSSANSEGRIRTFGPLPNCAAYHPRAYRRFPCSPALSHSNSLYTYTLPSNSNLPFHSA